MKPYKYWDKLPTSTGARWISLINSRVLVTLNLNLVIQERQSWNMPPLKSMWVICEDRLILDYQKAEGNDVKSLVY